jgi:hypothetical protein
MTANSGHSDRMRGIVAFLLSGRFHSLRIAVASLLGCFICAFAACGRTSVPIENATGIAFLDEDGAKAIISQASQSKWFFTATQGLPPERVDLFNEQEGVLLPLVGVKEITAGAAAVLASQKGALVLDGLTDLPTEIAASLCQHEGVLSLNGVGRLGNEAAGLLGTTKGSLYFDGLVSLDPETAAALSHHKLPLSLNGLKTISPASIEKLCTRAAATYLEGLEEIDMKQAKALSSAQGLVFLTGVKKAPARALEALKRNEKLFFGKDVVGVKD